MAVDFTEEIRYINNHSPITSYNFLSELPDKCPICSYSISPEYLLIYSREVSVTELLCGCPRNECGSLFFAEYIDMAGMTVFTGCYPSTKVTKDFPEEVTQLSPDFVAIFNQAYHAEQEDLDLICGVAYRKALEYLIKDYVLSINSEDKGKIKTMPLQQCIQKYVTEQSIKSMAERATWLGNDETHYVRKWENKDLKDLKNLIDLTVYFISMSLKALKYQEEMKKS